MRRTIFPAVIETPRLRLRLLQERDTETLFRLIDSQREFIGKYLDWVQYVKTLEDEQKYVASRIKHDRDLVGFNWIIETKDETFVGYIGTDPVSTELWDKGENIDWENGVVSFAYFIDSSQSGQGYMAEALKELIKISFSLGFNRVEIHTDKENSKSANVALRCGMISKTGKDWFITKQENAINFA